MDRACAVIIGTMLIVSTVEGATLSREKRQIGDSLCPQGTTYIRSRLISTSAWNTCPVGIVPQEFAPFVAECEYWMGARPDHVASSSVYSCLTSASGVDIRAEICCKTVAPVNRCVTFNQCPGNNLEKCDYEGTIKTCAPDERCETRMTCANPKTSAYSVAVKECVKTCSSSTSCRTVSYLNSGESCATCCSGAFCNRALSSETALTCVEAQTCNCPGMVTGNYHCSGTQCVCNAGCSGADCGTCTASCNPNPCQNGGRCETTSSGRTCCCKVGFTGDLCQTASATCDQATCNNHGQCFTENGITKCLCAEGYYGDRCQNAFSTFSCPDSRNVIQNPGTPYTASCADVSRTALSRTSELSACRYHMSLTHNSGLFEDGINGYVTAVTDAGYGVCNADSCGKAIYSTKICCPSCYSSPCQNGGYCVQIPPAQLSSSNQRDYVCRCKFGFTGDLCEKRVQTCFVFGEPHFRTFDGRDFDFQGKCKYILSSSVSSSLRRFSVNLQTETRGTDTSVTYPSSIEIVFADYVITLGRNKVVSVKPPNGVAAQVVSLPVRYGSDFTVEEQGLIVVATVADGLLRIGYDGYNLVYVQASDLYKGQLTGLCANMDGDVTNDLRDCNGIVQADSPSGDVARGDSCLISGQKTEQCRTPAPIACDSTPYRSNQYCGYIIDTNGPFGACASSESARMLYQACLFDVCRNQSNKCAALEAFASICRSEQFSVSSNWRATTNCPYDCPANSVYASSGSACQPTCENNNAADSCPVGNGEVCVCNTGYILQDGKCILRTDCGCRDSNNIRRKFGETWDLNAATCTQKICSKCADANCTTVGVVEQRAATSINGGWSDYGAWSGCDVTTNKLKRTRSCNNPAPSCGGQDCSGSSEEEQPCPTSTTPTTPPPPTTTTAPIITNPGCIPMNDFQRACQECDRTTNPLLYLADPCGCGYYQCQPTGSGYIVHHRSCSRCTCWNDAKKTCDLGGSTGANCPTEGPRVEYCTMGTNYYRPDSDPAYYNQRSNGVWYRMPCAPGTIWDQAKCTCVFGGRVQVKEYMCLTFDNPAHWLESSLYVSQTGIITYGHPGVVSYSAEFSTGTLEVPAFTNKEIWAGTWVLYFNASTTNRVGSMTLISNDDCNNQPSVLIRLDTLSSGQAFIRAGIRTQSNNLIDVLTWDVTPLTRSLSTRWHQLALTYDAHAHVAVFYLNGIQVASRSADGPILATHCPLRIGSTYVANYYYGRMDQICYYDRALTRAQVQDNYQASTTSG